MENPKVGPCGDPAPAYWYAPMVPQQRFDKPGKSPFMDMQLVPKCAATAEAPAGNAAPDAASSERKPLYWFDPMKPQQHFDKPGKSPFMDMQLVPQYPDEAAASAGAAAGSIAIDPRVDSFAAFDGYVMDLGARQGAAVAAGTMLFQLADLDSVWINAEVPEAQAAWIKTGDPATAELSALPGEHFQGQIDYLYPELMPTTRTLKVRVVIKNPGKRLRPGMFAAVRLRGTTHDQVLTVPTEAG